MVGRLRQVRSLVGRRHGVAPPPGLAAAPRTARMFASLPPHDQGHLLAVQEACVAEGLAAEMATAGLLHDIGKASLSGRRVTLVDRTLRVALARLSPRHLDRVTDDPTPGWRLGLRLAAQHAELGASRLSALGWPGAVVSAVREHEASPSSAAEAALRRIDDTTP